MRISDIRPAEDVPRLRETVARHQQGLLSTADWRHRLKDGRLIDVEITSHALEFAGRPAILAVVQDVTERERTEAENLRLITAIEQSAEAILITDPTGKIEYVNPSFTKITGYSRQEALGQNPRVLRSGKHDPAFYQNLWATILAGRTWRGEIINRRKDGSLYNEEASITPVRDEKGETTHFIAVKQDITERKRAEEALRQTEERYRGLFENSTYGIYRSTLEGKFLDANPALVQMLAYESKEELLAQDLATQIYRKMEERDQFIERYKQVGRIEGAEAEWRRKDGKAILVQLSGRRARDERSGLDCLEVIVEDITERRNLETQLRQSQKFEAVGLLAGGIAHDFNNMIGAIIGWADLGLGETQPGDRLQGFFQKVRQQADRAAALTRQLLAFARRQILEPRTLNLNETVAEATSLLEKVIGGDIEVQTRLAPDLQTVRADPVQIEQVLMNLCVNARDAMPQGGRLLLETANVELGEDFCQRHVYARPGCFVLLAVSDTGIGMDRATLEHIFEPFFTTKGAGKGTGLGLAMVYGIVKQHNGYVHVYSEPGAGTTFRVYLPVAQAAVQAPEKKEEATRVRGGEETILLAEDHEGMLEMALETLGRLGYQVLVARDGEEAVQLFEAHRDRIDLVLLDVVLPRLSGPDAYARICALRPQVRALFTTGYSAESARLDKLVETGAAILQKPYSPSVLAGRVREILDRGGQG
jgi:PAS domain S-box-containing protein